MEQNDFAPRAQLTLADFEAALERDPEGLAGVYSTTEIEQAFAARKFIDEKLKARRQEAARAVIVRARNVVLVDALNLDEVPAVRPALTFPDHAVVADEGGLVVLKRMAV